MSGLSLQVAVEIVGKKECVNYVGKFEVMWPIGLGREEGARLV